MSFQVDAIKARIDIRAVVERYTEIDRRGRGLCPFHQEETPSFFIDEKKQLYHCFGCGAGGDVVRFVERIEGLAFPQALGRLARWYGISPRHKDAGTERLTHALKSLTELERWLIELERYIYDDLAADFRRLPTRSERTARDYTDELMLEERWEALDRLLKRRKAYFAERRRKARASAYGGRS